MKKWGFVFWLKWHFWRYLVPCTSPACRRQVLRTMKSCFLYLGSCFLAYLVPCTWYFVQWNEVLLLDTNYLILFLISNDELRSKNEEVGICVLTQMTLLKVLGTLYLVLCTMKSCYLILTTWYFFTIERWTPIEEWRSGDLWSDSNGTSEGAWYLVLCTMKSCYLILTTWYFFPMSNAELRLMNEEVGICVLTQMALLKVPGTLYLVLQWSLASCVSVLASYFNIERWTPIEEWRSGDLCSDSNDTSEGTWYLVLRLPAAGRYFVQW
jgi:hypothetical protein